MAALESRLVNFRDSFRTSPSLSASQIKATSAAVGGVCDRALRKFSEKHVVIDRVYSERRKTSLLSSGVKLSLTPT